MRLTNWIVSRQLRTHLKNEFISILKAILELHKNKENHYFLGNGDRHAVLCYLGKSEVKNHNNFSQQAIIGRALANIGYSVHVISNHSIPYYITKPELIIGFGVSWRYLKAKYPTSVCILYATEAPPFIAYLNESRALARLKVNDRSIAKIQRAYKFYLDNDYLDADYIFQMGQENSQLLKSMSAFRSTPIFEISTTGIAIELSRPKLSLGKEFLWFGSLGVVHKGLDMCFEVMKQNPTYKLNVAGCSFQDFMSLNPPTNAQYHGVLDPYGNEFSDLINNCIAFLLPSASEGISTAAITCMYRGLIPIVTKEVNLGFQDGYVIDSNVESLLSAMKSVHLLPADVLSEKSEKIRNSALSRFSENCFENSIATALKSVEK